jgi:glucose-6-phosphate isomerase
VNLRLDNDVAATAALAARFHQQTVLARLRALDSKARRHGVEGLDPSRNELIAIGMETTSEGRVIKNGYGVFHLAWLAAKDRQAPQRIRDEIDAIRAGIHATHGVTLKYVLWAGMGGSAEDKSMYAACGLLRRGPKLYVIDSTDPAKLKAVLADITRRAGSLEAALRATLVVGMAMGMTSFEPVVNLRKLAELYAGLGLDSRPNFLYMTLPNSLLDQFAAPRGYRKVELQLDHGNTSAGRHSAPLTRGSLYPLALAGVPLGAWIAGAQLNDDDIAMAFHLAAFLAAHAGAGRDKVTLALGKSLAGAALWTKQDFEESLGKSAEQGIKIIIHEPFRLADYRAPKDARQDRVFLLVERKGEPALDRRKFNVLKRAGYAVAVLTLEQGAPLSRYLQFIHYTVFGLAWLWRMNFVTQPSVELYKAITNPLYENSVFQGGIENTPEWKQFIGSPRQVKWRGGVVLHYDRLPCGLRLDGRSAAEAYAALLEQFGAAGAVEYGELTYFGDTRYDAAGRRMRKVLEHAAAGVFRGALHMPADVYEGPAMNHSYHEMVIGHGRALSTVLLSRKGETLAAVNYTPDYHRAQFLATQMALEQHNRLVVAITVKDLGDASLHGLEEFFAQVAVALRKKHSPFAGGPLARGGDPPASPCGPSGGLRGWA